MRKLCALIAPLCLAPTLAMAAYDAKNKTTDNVCCESLWDIGVGIFYDEKVENMLPYATLVYDDFLTIGFGANYEHSKILGESGSETSLVAHVGGRYELWDCAYFTAGVSGSYTFDSHDHRNDPWIVGPYVGLDYKLTSHLLLTFQIMPYSYERTAESYKQNEVFQEGMLGLSYMF